MKQLYMEEARNEITWNAPRKYSQLGTILLWHGSSLLIFQISKGLAHILGIKWVHNHHQNRARLNSLECWLI